MSIKPSAVYAGLCGLTSALSLMVMAVWVAVPGTGTIHHSLPADCSSSLLRICCNGRCAVLALLCRHHHLTSAQALRVHQMLLYKTLLSSMLCLRACSVWFVEWGRMRGKYPGGFMTIHFGIALGLPWNVCDLPQNLWYYDASIFLQLLS